MRRGDTKDNNGGVLPYLDNCLMYTDLRGIDYAVIPRDILPKDTYTYVLATYGTKDTPWETYIAYNNDRFFRKSFPSKFLSVRMFFSFLVISKWYSLKHKRNLMEDILEENFTINMSMLSKILKDLKRIRTNYNIGFAYCDEGRIFILDDRRADVGIYGCFYSDWGEKKDIITFNSEFDACLYFLSMLVEYDAGIGFK